MEEEFELQAELLPTPTPTPQVKKTVSKKAKPCPNCPDPLPQDLLREKVLSFKNKGYNDNQVASLLGVAKAIVENIK